MRTNPLLGIIVAKGAGPKALFPHLSFGIDIGFAGDASELAKNAGRGIDEKPPAFVDGIATEDAAVDDLGPFEDNKVAADIAIDVNAAAVGDLEIAIDRAADVHFSTIDDGDVSGDDAPEINGFGDDLVAVESAAFFAHGDELRGKGGNCK